MLLTSRTTMHLKIEWMVTVSVYHDRLVSSAVDFMAPSRLSLPCRELGRWSWKDDVSLSPAKVTAHAHRTDLQLASQRTRVRTSKVRYFLVNLSSYPGHALHFNFGLILSLRCHVQLSPFLPLWHSLSILPSLSLHFLSPYSFILFIRGMFVLYLEKWKENTKCYVTIVIWLFFRRSVWIPSIVRLWHRRLHRRPGLQLSGHRLLPVSVRHRCLVADCDVIGVIPGLVRVVSGREWSYNWRRSSGCAQRADMERDWWIQQCGVHDWEFTEGW